MLKAQSNHLTVGNSVSLPNVTSARPSLCNSLSRRPLASPAEGRRHSCLLEVLQSSRSTGGVEALQLNSSVSGHSVYLPELPKLTPTWELLATLDALAVPWGVKQLSMAFMSSHMLGISPPAEYYVLNWAISVLCYLIDHYKDQGSVGDVINVPIRLAMVKRHRAALKAHLAISLGLVISSLALLPGTVLQAFIPGIIAVSAYWLPILPNGRTAKQLPAAKNFFCSGVETFALVAFALTSVPAVCVSPVVVAATTVFFVAVNVGLAVLADVRDIQGDIVAGTNSIPVIYGVPAALNVAVACCTVACLAATVAMPHMWPATASVAMILGAGWGFIRDAHEDSSRGPSFSTMSDTFVSWFQASVGLVGCIALHIC